MFHGVEKEGLKLYQNLLDAKVPASEGLRSALEDMGPNQTKPCRPTDLRILST